MQSGSVKRAAYPSDMNAKKVKNARFKDEEFLRLLGEHCRRLRTKKGVSVNRMAREAEKLSPSVIIRLESGSGAVTVSALLRFAEVLEVHPKKLLDFDFDTL